MKNPALYRMYWFGSHISVFQAKVLTVTAVGVGKKNHDGLDNYGQRPIEENKGKPLVANDLATATPEQEQK